MSTNPQANSPKPNPAPGPPTSGTPAPVPPSQQPIHPGLVVTEVKGSQPPKGAVRPAPPKGPERK